MQTMDIRRLILFAIFFSSAFFLWNAWQQEHAPPPPPPVAKAPAAPGQRAGAAKDMPVPSAAVPAPRSAQRAPAAFRCPPAPRSAAGGQKVTIKTDLYTAEVDTLGGVISLVSLGQAPGRDRPDQAVPRAAAHDRPHVRRAGGASSARACRITARRRKCRAGSARARGGQPTGSSCAYRHHAHRRQGGAGAHLPSRQLPHRRRLRHHQRQQGSRSRPFAYFQLTRDTKQAVVQSSMAPAAYVGPVVYNDKDNFKKIEFGEIDKQAADPNRKPRLHQVRRQRLGRHDRALLRRGLAAVRRDEDAARVLHPQARQRPVRRRRDRAAWAPSRPARPARCACRCTSARRTRRCSPRPRRASTSSSTTASSPCSPRRSSCC